MFRSLHLFYIIVQFFIVVCQFVTLQTHISWQLIAFAVSLWQGRWRCKDTDTSRTHQIHIQILMLWELC